MFRYPENVYRRKVRFLAKNRKRFKPRQFIRCHVLCYHFRRNADFCGNFYRGNLIMFLTCFSCKKSRLRKKLFKILRTVFTNGTNEIFRQGIAFVNITANFANVCDFLRRFNLRFYANFVQIVHHGRHVGYVKGLNRSANK